MSHLRLGRYKLKLPRTKTGRRALGGALLAGGMLSFLPVLGLWMLPAGLAVLSTDSHKVRRLRRVGEVKALRWWRMKASRAMQPEKEKGPGEPGPKFG